MAFPGSVPAQTTGEKAGGWSQRSTSSTRLQTISHILLQDKIEERIKNAVPVDSYIASLIDRQRQTVGREFVWSVRTQLNEATGMVREDEPLPAWGHPSGIQPTGKPKSMYMAMALTGESMVMAPRVTRATFARTLSDALQAFEDGWRLEKGFQIWSPVSSVIAQLKTALSSNSSKDIEVHNPYGINPVTATSGGVDELFPMFRPGMRLWFHDETGNGANAETATVTAFKTPDTLSVGGTDGATITIDKVIDTLPADTKIYKWSGLASTSGNMPQNDKDQGFSGILELFYGGSKYYNITKADYPIWKPIVHDLGAEELSEDALQTMWDRTKIYSHMPKPSILISNFKAARVYQALLTDNRRYHNTMSLKGGYNVLDYNGMPWTKDKRCPPEHLFYLTPSDWCWLMTQSERWLDINNPGHMFQWTGRNTWQAYRWFMGEIVCKMPNRQYLMTKVDA